jgi:hypothetical protein
MQNSESEECPQPTNVGLEEDPSRDVLSAVDHRLLNGRQLVERLGVRYDFFKDMRLAGFQPPISGLTTLGYAVAWLNRNPDFRENARILKQSRRPKQFVNRRQ